MISSETKSQKPHKPSSESSSELLAENSYELSLEELTCPDTGKAEWFENLILRQREGVDNGVRPQNPRGLGKSRRTRWRGQVWNYYIKNRPKMDRQVISDTTKPSRNIHTGSSRTFIKR